MKSSSIYENKDQKNIILNIQKISHKYDSNLIKISDKSFPMIFLTKQLSNNAPLVMKLYQFDEKTWFETFQSEIKKTIQLTNQTYCDIIDYMPIKEKSLYEIYLFLERADFSLNELIFSISENIPKPEPELLQIYSDLAYSLQYAHQNNFFHGNIHPENILVFCSRERPIEAQKFNVFTKNMYKLTDWRFECLGKSQTRKEHFTDILTKNSAFKSPEFYNLKEEGEINYKACDVYSLAMSILHCCGIPLKKLLPISISEKEIHDFQLEKIFQEISKIYDYKFVEILKMSLVYENSKRWNIDQIIYSLKNLSKCSTMIMTNEINHDINENNNNEKKPKRGILKKLFSGIFKGKKRKSIIKNLENQNNCKENNENLNEFFYNTKPICLLVYSKEDYNSVFSSKSNKNSNHSICHNNEIFNIWKQIKSNSLNALKVEFRTENTLGNDNLEVYSTILKDNAKIQELSRVSMISTPEKVGGDLGNFLSNYYFSNSLTEAENNLYENTFNFIHYFQKNQNAGLSNEEIIILLKNLHHFVKQDLKSLNLIFKSYEKLTDETLKNVGYLLQNYGDTLREFNLFFTGQNITDEGVAHVLRCFNETIMKAPIINLEKLGLGFGGKKKLTDASLIEVSKTLITLSSRVHLSKLYLYFNSFELSNDGLDSLGTALRELSKSLTEITIFLITWDQITDEGVLLLLRDIILKSKKLLKITIGIKSVGLSSEGITILYGLLSKSECKFQNLNIYFEQMSNRNIDLEKDFKEKLLKIHTEVVFGDILIKV